MPPRNSATRRGRGRGEGASATQDATSQGTTCDAPLSHHTPAHVTAARLAAAGPLTPSLSSQLSAATPSRVAPHSSRGEFGGEGAGTVGASATQDDATQGATCDATLLHHTAADVTAARLAAAGALTQSLSSLYFRPAPAGCYVICSAGGGMCARRAGSGSLIGSTLMEALP
jgi:hypothetical protein